MRAILIISVLILGMAFVGYKVYHVLTYSKEVIQRDTDKLSEPIPHPDKSSRDERPDAGPELVRLYTLRQVIENPLEQRTVYDQSKGTLSGIANYKGVYTAYTTDGRVIAHSQIQGIGRDWVLLKTGALLRYPPPRVRVDAETDGQKDKNPTKI